MSLDGLIMRRSYGERGRGRVRGWGQGQGLSSTFVGRGVRMLRQGPLRINRSSPFKIAKSFSRTKGLLWRHDLFEDSMAAAGLAGAEGGTKLYISNLDHGVSNEDIKELFSEVGDLKRSTTHYDRNGRSSGSAEVVYTRRSDAIAAVKRYNNVQLDGKPMKIEIIGNNLGLPVAPKVNVVGGVNGRGKRTVVMTKEIPVLPSLIRSYRDIAAKEKQVPALALEKGIFLLVQIQEFILFSCILLLPVAYRKVIGSGGNIYTSGHLSYHSLLLAVFLGCCINRKEEEVIFPSAKGINISTSKRSNKGQLKQKLELCRQQLARPKHLQFDSGSSHYTWSSLISLRDTSHIIWKSLFWLWDSIYTFRITPKRIQTATTLTRSLLSQSG